MGRSRAAFVGKPLLDIASYARRGPGRRLQVSGSQLALIARTVRRTPEVMVKVSGGGGTVKAVAAHLKYIDRKGKLEIETDDGQQHQGKGAEAKVLDDWNLEDELAESQLQASGRPGRKPRKLVHSIVLSMPAGTAADKLLAASKDFAREQFALKHRYALVLHTDQEHPHVHLVVKAMGEDGQRLNIRKADLREWRSEFARHLREHGVAANATERAVRDQLKAPKPDGLYRAERRREGQGGPAEPVQSSFPGLSASTRKAVREGWRVVLGQLQELQQPANEKQPGRAGKRDEPER